MIWILLPEQEGEERDGYRQQDQSGRRPGHDEAVARMHAPGPRVVDQPPLGARPQIGRGELAENALVAFQRFGILLEEQMLLTGAAFARVMVQLAAEHLGAEALPIIAAVGE